MEKEIIIKKEEDAYNLALILIKNNYVVKVVKQKVDKTKATYYYIITYKGGVKCD